MARVTVPVDDALRRHLRTHPEEFGFAPDVSEARALAKLIEVGARSLLEERAEIERVRLYAEWADDPERRDAVREAMDLAIEDGVL